MPVRLTETATLWRKTGNDGFGGFTFDAPIQIACKHALTSTYDYNQQGRRDEATDVYYTNSEVGRGDFILLGASVEADPVSAGASEVNYVKPAPLHPGLYRAII